MKRFVLSLFVLVTACTAYGQSVSQPPPSQPSSADTAVQTAPAQTPTVTVRKPAKVWTDDDVETLHESRGVSVVGNAAGSKKTSAPSQSASYQKDPAWYRRQLAPLQANVEKLDSQIAKLHQSISGENVSEPQPYYHAPPGNPQDQLKQLEKKRDADAAKISDLLDSARHNGIEPGALR